MILIVFKCQNSSLDYNDTIKKFIEKKMEQSIMTKLLMNANRKYWILVNWNEERLCYCTELVNWQMGISSGKRRRTEEKVSIMLENELSSSIPLPSNNPRPAKKYNQSCIARQCTVTRRFYRVFSSRRKRKRIEVNSESWFDSKKNQSQNKQTRCVLHYCDPMDNQDGLGETLCDLSQARIVPYQNTIKRFSEYSILKLAQQRTVILSNKITRNYFPRHTACRVHWESDYKTAICSGS